MPFTPRVSTNDIIRKGSYIRSFAVYYQNTIESLIKQGHFSELEIHRGFYTLIGAMDGILRSLENNTRTLDGYLRYIPIVKQWIEAKTLSDEASMQHYYNDVRAFIHKDSREIAEAIKGTLKNRVIIDEERMPEYKEIMYKVAQDCIEFCCNEFRKDIENYQKRTRVSWEEKVQILRIEDEKFVAERSEEPEMLKNNEGQGVLWRQRVRQENRQRNKTSSTNNQGNLG